MELQTTANPPHWTTQTPTARARLAVWRAAVLTVLSLIGTFVLLAVVVLVVAALAAVWMVQLVIEARFSNRTVSSRPRRVRSHGHP
jgi:hypothetical protein